MANNYVHAAFAVTVTASEAQLIAGVEAPIEAIDQDLLGEARQEAYDNLGPAFAAAFPPIGDDPFSGLMPIFPNKTSRAFMPRSSLKMAPMMPPRSSPSPASSSA